MHILRQLARQTRRELDQHDGHVGDAESTGRREYLVRAAKRTLARVADAQRRRNGRAKGIVRSRQSWDPRTAANAQLCPSYRPDRWSAGRVSPITSASRPAGGEVVGTTAVPVTRARKARP
jgi:hypothetical protein